MRNSFAVALVFAIVLAHKPFLLASNHYTTKQLDALAERVGGEFWINAPAGKAPPFLTAPAPNAASFRPADSESFEISELVGRVSKNPYFKVRFQSGKVAYLRPEIFNEEINATILTSDPRAAEKLKSEQAAEAEKERVAWINAQPWPPAVKEAATKKQPPPGLTTDEIRQVMGAPRRITKTGGQLKGRNPLQVHEERWYYADGSILLFRNNVLNQVEHRATK